MINYMDTPTASDSSELIAKVRSIEKQVGNTPLYEITRLFAKSKVRVYAKQEWKQLSGSVKARAAYSIIRGAIERGELTRHKILLDATSGNTGIAYASIGALLNIRVALCLPENASRERKEILRSLGAELILTSPFEGTDGAQQEALSLAEANPEKYFYADQYKNPDNWKAHYRTTAVEIFRDLPGITHFVAGLGTTGTFVGTSRRLRELKPSIRLISLQPELAMHGMEGWKHLETAIVPGIYDDSIADETLEISTEEAYEMMGLAFRQENLLLSPSSAANLAGALKIANEIEQGILVTVFPDNADKYSEVLKTLNINTNQ